MRNACLLFGPPRTFKKTIDKIKEFILLNNKFDIFISTGPNNQNELNIFEEYIKYIQPIDFIITHTRKLHQDLLNSMSLKCTGNADINQYKINMYNGWYKKNIGLNLIKSYEKEHCLTYDNILIYRPDVKPNEEIKLNFNLEKNTIYSNYISNNYDGWIGDLMALGDRNSMEIYLSYYEKFEKKFKNKDNFHPETSLYEYLISNNLNLSYYKHDCLIVRENEEYRIF